MTTSSVHLVGKKGHADIGSALRLARSGDVIEIAPGTYDGEVVIDKAVEVRPQQGAGTVTLTSATGNTLMVLAGATVRDLTVVGNGWNWAAVEVAGHGVTAKIANCDIRAPQSVGIRVRGGANPVVADCRIGPAAQGLRVEAAEGFYKRCVFSDVALESVIAAAGATPTVLNCVFNGPAVATDQATVLTLDNCEIEGGTVKATGGGQVTITKSTIHGGGPALELADDGVLRANNVRIAGTAPEGILISGGDGAFTDCLITGTHGPAVWMTAGRARFERCEAVDADAAGFLVVGGDVEFLECVAHNNADQGFALLTEVDLTECSSYGNGKPDGVGIHTPAPPEKSTPPPKTPEPPAPPERNTPPPKTTKPSTPKSNRPKARRDGPVRRVGSGGYRTIGEAIDAARAGDVIEVEPGTYTEELTVDKPVEIKAVGEPGSVHLRHSSAVPLWLRADATLRGIAVSSDTSGSEIAYVVGNGVGAIFDQCTFTGAGLSGVVVSDGARAMFARCDLHGAGVSVIDDRAAAGLQDCTVTAADQGLAVYNGRMELTNVVVRGGNVGLALFGGSVAATGLTIADTETDGIQVSDGLGAFTDCEVVGAGADGVRVTGGRVEFEECRAIGSDQSGFNVGGDTATFTRCTAKDNGYKGFDIFDKATIAACRSVDNGTEDEVGIQPDGPGPHVLRVRTYVALKQALRNASHGDTIELEAGTYSCDNQVRISAGVEVRSAKSTGTVRLIPEYDPIVISGSATLRNITIDAEYQIAVVITGDSGLIDGCKISATGEIAVKVAKGATPTLRDCVIGPAKQGLVVRDAGGRYERCKFTATPEPVLVSNSKGLEFIDCVIVATEGKQVAATGKNPPLTVSGDRLSGRVDAGRHGTIRADREPELPPANTETMISGLRVSLALLAAKVDLQRQLGLATPSKLAAAEKLISKIKQEIQGLEDFADGREFPTLPENEKRIGREFIRRINNHAAKLDELLA